MGQTLKLKYFLVGLLLLISVGFYFINSYYDSARHAPVYADLILHFLGGLWVAGAAAYFLLTNRIFLSPNFWLNAFLLVALSALIGVFWEFYEYVVASLLTIGQDPLDDVLSDLLMDILGGTAFVLFYKLKALVSGSQ